MHASLEYPIGTLVHLQKWSYISVQNTMLTFSLFPKNNLCTSKLSEPRMEEAPADLCIYIYIHSAESHECVYVIAS